ncbi:flagella basal body P-ring formation protein FlgA [Helicobacter didelphidarum]|uniref:Flagella basal body P-ring formation protein FlgA n=1 Tax=Helicobacter didelphidarum TaxID=2040648 RepID=A0A3D8IF97_9HELI|nr:flagellar basal body P-ring formation chaperone FlgA [Helicobacter didelphidarum]RDU63221.1 flagella basal body P-ring formation protein FlgA [Helicobacter didelphidarum]
MLLKNNTTQKDIFCSPISLKKFTHKYKKILLLLFIGFTQIICLANNDNVVILKNYIKNEYSKTYPEIHIESISLITRNTLNLYNIELLSKNLNSIRNSNGYVTVSYKYNNKILQENIKYTIQANIRIYIASDNIPAKSNFNTAKFTERLQDFSILASIPATKAEILQSSAKVYIPANSIISRNKLSKRILIAKDSQVKIILRTDGIEAITTGKSVENGVMGDIIKIENLESKRTISGEVIGENIVLIR